MFFGTAKKKKNTSKVFQPIYDKSIASN